MISKKGIQEEPILKDELWALEAWHRNIKQQLSTLRRNIKAYMAEEKLVVNIIKEWKKLKQ